MAYVIDLPDGTSLLIMDPQPLFPELEKAFWDGQPRTPDGRFTFGKMPSYIIVKKLDWHFTEIDSKKRAREIRGILGETKLTHKDLPGTVGFYVGGLRHVVSTYDSYELELLMRSPEIMREVFAGGKCKEEPVHQEKEHFSDRCWHVKRMSKINGHTCRIEFVILHHKDLMRNVLYDVDLVIKKSR